MQASPALNDNSRLPRPLQRQLADVQSRIDARKPAESDTASDPADPNKPAATPAPPAADPRESDPAYWKQRFKVTEGFLAKERQERKDDADGFRQRITELQEQIRSLQAAQPSAPATVDVTQFLSPEQIELLGEDEAKSIVSTAVKAATVEARKLIDAELAPLREQRTADAKGELARRKQAFLESLAEQVPDHEEIDKDERWLSWLAETDEATGLERQEILNKHIGKLNPAGVAKLFKDWKASVAPPPPPVAPQGSATPAGVAPAPSDPGLTPLRPGEAKAFFTKAALGKVSDAERKLFEARRKLTGRQ